MNTAYFFSSGAKNKELKKLFGTLKKVCGEQAIQINDTVLHGLGLKQSKLLKRKGNARFGLFAHNRSLSFKGGETSQH